MKTIAPLSKVQYGIYVECVGYEGEARYNLPYLSFGSKNKLQLFMPQVFRTFLQTPPCSQAC